MEHVWHIAGTEDGNTWHTASILSQFHGTLRLEDPHVGRFTLLLLTQHDELIKSQKYV